jgi:hypothetical protein
MGITPICAPKDWSEGDLVLGFGCLGVWVFGIWVFAIGLPVFP